MPIEEKHSLAVLSLSLSQVSSNGFNKIPFLREITMGNLAGVRYHSNVCVSCIISIGSSSFF
jgi:hypothetical protein